MKYYFITCESTESTVGETHANKPQGDPPVYLMTGKANKTCHIGKAKKGIGNEPACHF